MATRAETIPPILDAVPGTTARRMFGEYAIYLSGRVVALVCDDRLWVKAMDEARALLPGAEEEPPFPGAKPYLAADAWLDEPEVLTEALRAVAEALPPPKPKSPKTRKPKGAA
ncbi:TfoX/Sxy family protein [Neotabrizicola shimadae]|uniref:TfoX/Sxy family protein n=1 Tax=Neotabrizicola shimadae TaxID=2807096 RepID=A0A8G0ZUN2_9RHOB|nr:TfoX/Sxy family protein [Neotabrizicola shimadae]QYZ69008.1 TfoX/Sxy family protein [Neotabrizicola shimadae]